MSIQLGSQGDPGGSQFKSSPVSIQFIIVVIIVIMLMVGVVCWKAGVFDSRSQPAKTLTPKDI